MRARLALVPLLLLAATTAHGACPDAAEVDAFIQDYQAARVTRGMPAVQTLDDARCAQAAVVQRLQGVFGPVVGYKAGLTNPAMQKRLGVDQPVSGVMMNGMFLPDGSEFDVGAAARPLYEADFIMVVKDGPGLARARSLQEAARSIAYVVPFIELPDLMFDPALKLTGPGLVAIDAGARHGVLGKPIPMQTDDAFIQSLATMTVVLLEDGRELAKGLGSAIMDNPLNSAMWLARDLASVGIELKPGDKLSLGSFLPAQPPRAGTKGTVQYLGLPGDPIVSVSFK